MHWVENGTAGISVKPWDRNAGPWSFILGCQFVGSPQNWDGVSHARPRWGGMPQGK